MLPLLRQSETVLRPNIVACHLSVKYCNLKNVVKLVATVAEPEPVGAGTFWSEPESEPVCRSGSGSTLDETKEILNDILFGFFCSNTD